MSTLLKSKQRQAKADFLVTQLLLSARILNYDGYFEILAKDGSTKPAIFDNGRLVESFEKVKATTAQIKTIYNNRIHPMLCDESGTSYTFEEKDIDYPIYFDENKKDGFAHLDYKLYYKVTANGDKNKLYGLTFPITGFGLWDTIHALLCVQPDCNTILGFSCYDHKETPGLGGEISEAWWQNQFYGKKIFRADKNGNVDFSMAPLGINVVKPGQLETLNKRQKNSSVNGVTGASITSKGIMQGIKNSLAPYRNLLLRTSKDHE